MLGAFENTLEAWLRTERLLPKRQRRTARRLFEGLQADPRCRQPLRLTLPLLTTGLRSRWRMAP